MFNEPRRFHWSDWQILEQALRDEQINSGVIDRTKDLFLEIQEDNSLEDIIAASVIEFSYWNDFNFKRTLLFALIR